MFAIIHLLVQYHCIPRFYVERDDGYNRIKSVGKMDDENGLI